MIFKKVTFILASLFIVLNTNAQIQEAWNTDFDDDFSERSLEEIGIAQLDNEDGIEILMFDSESDYSNGSDVMIYHFYAIDLITGKLKYKFETTPDNSVENISLLDVNEDGISEILIRHEGYYGEDIGGLTLYSFGSLSATAIESVHFENEMNLKAYPNPAKDEFTLEYNLLQRSKLQLKFYNEAGTLLKIIDRGFEAEGVHSLSMNMSELTRNNATGGFYFCQAIAGKNTSTCKLVKAQ